jgi:hypothetical protein
VVEVVPRLVVPAVLVRPLLAVIRPLLVSAVVVVVPKVFVPAVLVRPLLAVNSPLVVSVVAVTEPNVLVPAVVKLDAVRAPLESAPTMVALPPTCRVLLIDAPPNTFRAPTPRTVASCVLRIVAVVFTSMPPVVVEYEAAVDDPELVIEPTVRAPAVTEPVVCRFPEPRFAEVAVMTPTLSDPVVVIKPDPALRDEAVRAPTLVGPVVVISPEPAFTEVAVKAPTMSDPAVLIDDAVSAPVLTAPVIVAVVACSDLAETAPPHSTELLNEPVTP